MGKPKSITQSRQNKKPENFIYKFKFSIIFVLIYEKTSHGLTGI